MVQVIESDNSWADAFRNLGSGLGKGYTDRSDQNAIQKSIQDLGPNASPRQILDALTKTKTYSPKAKQDALSNYLGVEKFEELKRSANEQEQIAKARNTIAQNKLNQEANKETQERNSIKNLANQLDLPEEQKAALGENASQQAIESLLKDQLKPAEDVKLTPGQKKIAEKNAEEYITLTKEIPELETNAADIDYAEQLSKDLGKTGVITSALGISGKADELEAVSFTLMKPIVKIFNPSGPIAQQKLKMIQDKYAIKGTDAPWKKQAKIDALRRFNTQALKRAKDRMELFKKYDANPPVSVIEQFDKESDSLSDAMIDYDFVGEEAKDQGLPGPEKFKGKTITSPEGVKYHSDGTKWVKK